MLGISINLFGMAGAAYDVSPWLAVPSVIQLMPSQSNTMKISAVISLLCMGSVTAFAPSLSHHTRASTSSLYASTDGENNQLSRRAILSNVLASTTASLLTPLVSFADDAAPSSTATKVVVAGATGQTGRRILERLAAQPNLSVVAGVRNVEKASKSLSEESTVVRGAMVQKIPSLDAAGVELKKLDGEIVIHMACFANRSCFVRTFFVSSIHAPTSDNLYPLHLNASL